MESQGEGKATQTANRIKPHPSAAHLRHLGGALALVKQRLVVGKLLGGGVLGIVQQVGHGGLLASQDVVVLVLLVQCSVDLAQRGRALGGAGVHVGEWCASRRCLSHC